jgi:hypothetical protein
LLLRIICSLIYLGDKLLPFTRLQALFDSRVHLLPFFGPLPALLAHSLFDVPKMYLGTPSLTGRFVGCVSLLAALLIQSTSTATSITYNFDHTLSGFAPQGPTPWLTATFADSGAGSVNLTLSAAGLIGTESVSQWYFNLSPALDPAGLTFTRTASAGSFANPAVSVGSDAFKPDHDGKYDIQVNFGEGEDNSTRFGGGDSVTFSITGIPQLRATDFLFGNTPAAGHGEILTAAYIQTVGQAIVIDTPPGPVPDSSLTLLLLGFAGIPLELCRRLFARSGGKADAPA